MIVCDTEDPEPRLSYSGILTVLEKEKYFEPRFHENHLQEMTLIEMRVTKL